MSESAAVDRGESIYRYYCYQCHGYAGDARTLASRYLSPPPRSFRETSIEALPADRMTAAILNGRPGTAMVSFSSVLSADDVTAVVNYVRRAFMTPQPLAATYHSAENGWPEQDRYRTAFPFVEGRITITTPWENLSSEERAGRRLFESACITCHEPTSDETTVWEPSAVSYPRRHYSHRQGESDFVSAASPYRLHDEAPRLELESAAAQRGQTLYSDNCAFCHAQDGSGKNWIGSFMEPRPRDLRRIELYDRLGEIGLRQRIRDGLPGTSMPAWQTVLTDDEIDAIVVYLIEGIAAPPDDQ